MVEYLREINDAYQELWRETVLLDNDYFTAIGQVSVVAQAQIFDLRYNGNGALNVSLHPRLFQPVRVRVLPPNGANWVRTEPQPFNDSGEMAVEQQFAQPPSTTGPYRWQYFNRGLLRFGRPLPIGTLIEVVYTFGYFNLNVLGNGTLQTTGGAGAGVTGAGTTFLSLIGPDYQAPASPTMEPSTGTLLPLEIAVEAEIVINPSVAPVAYKVNSIAGDLVLTLYTAPIVAIPAATPYALANVPEIPEPHRVLIATLATRNMLAVPAIVQDARFAYWDAKCERDLDRYKDSIVERQQQAVPHRQRFPMGYGRGLGTGVQ